MHKSSSGYDPVLRVEGFTRHAAIRMQQRGIPACAVSAALTYGRLIQAKGITYYVIGRKEVQHYAALGTDLSDIEGLQVLIATDGAVVTAYRNRDLHSIKATPRRGRHRCQY